MLKRILNLQCRVKYNIQNDRMKTCKTFSADNIELFKKKAIITENWIE